MNEGASGGSSPKQRSYPLSKRLIVSEYVASCPKPVLHSVASSKTCSDALQQWSMWAHSRHSQRAPTWPNVRKSVVRTKLQLPYGRTITKPSPLCLRSIEKYKSAILARCLTLASLERTRAATSLPKPAVSISGIRRQICLKFLKAFVSIRFSIKSLKSCFSATIKLSFLIFRMRPSIAYPAGTNGMLMERPSSGLMSGVFRRCPDLWLRVPAVRYQRDPHKATTELPRKASTASL